MSIEIKGIIPAMVTAMNPDESLNENGIRAQVRRHIAAGVDGVFCLGTNGEFYIMDEAEKLEVIRITVSETARRVPVYAGTGCVSTRETVRLSQKAQETGADVLSVICPYFAAASQDELMMHFKTVAENVDLPIVLYNIPARTGMNLAPATVETLSKVKNIVGVKDSSGNFDNMLQYIERTAGSDFSVLSGNDALILWNLLAGGAGGITAVANVYPETMVSIYQRFKSGDPAGARAAQDSIRGFRNCFQFGNPNTIVKTATRMLGEDVGGCRAPFNGVTEQAVQALRKVLDENTAKGMR